MSLLIDGMKVGLILCFMIGPIFFSLIQTGLEEGVKAGTAVGLGVWLSDILLVGGIYLGLSYLRTTGDWSGLPLALGLGGSLILIFFGLGALLRRPSADCFRRSGTRRTSSYLSLWMRGFLINIANPFTILFWTGLMSTVIIRNHLAGVDASLFFGGLIGTVILTDLLKVCLAKKIRSMVEPVHLLWLRRISGSALIVFGVALFVRAVLLT